MRCSGDLQSTLKPDRSEGPPHSVRIAKRSRLSYRRASHRDLFPSANENMPKNDRSRRPSAPPKLLQRWRTSLSGDRQRFAAICLFTACVFAMGGGSRADIQSLIILRPLAFLFAAYALMVIRPPELRAAGRPLALLGLLGLVAIGQLVPLPPGIWTALPGRDQFAQIASDAGLPLGYRPVTLSPARTMNMAFSLGVPLAALLLVAIQSEAGLRRIAGVLLIGGAISALVAIAQLAGVGGGSLYFYRVTNPDFPVGLLANRNHQALLMAVVLILMAEMARRTGVMDGRRPLIAGGLLIGGLVVIALLLVSGSRAGLLLAALAVVFAAVILASGRAGREGPNPKSIRKRWWIAATVVGILALIGTMVVFSRAESIDRLWASDTMDDYRLQRLPLLLDMLRDHWAAGIGFGAFEGVYRSYETVDALSPFIFNQAHNDWLQFPMEGGIPAIIILGLALVLLASRARMVFARAISRRANADFAWLAILALIMAASVVDYPLRTPIFMVVGTMAFAILCRRAETIARD